MRLTSKGPSMAPENFLFGLLRRMIAVVEIKTSGGSASWRSSTRFLRSTVLVPSYSRARLGSARRLSGAKRSNARERAVAWRSSARCPARNPDWGL